MLNIDTAKQFIEWYEQELVKAGVSISSINYDVLADVRQSAWDKLSEKLDYSQRMYGLSELNRIYENAMYAEDKLNELEDRLETRIKELKET